ncbi:MAG: Rrf2 family transcriptional regulator [Ignavibacteriae bacterium]|nr:Rrf2 family transcriptional regulator [Ignavibacteriota bacterium]MCB9217369.1 Rrf2 family transcriptional regulator [Ignavibacteria bacterium]
MKFSTQEEYGLRCLLQIARAEHGKSLTIPEISQSEGLSEAHVAKLLRILRMGGFIQSERGRDGGYTLARNPDEIVLGSVLASLGGRIIEDDFCAKHSGTSGLCVHSVDCTVMSLWENVQGAIDNVLFTTKLQDLLPTPEIVVPVMIGES